MTKDLNIQSQIHALLLHVSGILDNPEYKEIWGSNKKHSHFIDYFFDSLHDDLKKHFVDFQSSFKEFESKNHPAQTFSHIIPLNTVFQKIKLHHSDTSASKKNIHYSANPLSIELNKNIPSDPADNNLFKNQTHKLIKEFINDLKIISNIKSPGALVHTLYFLLHRYFSRVSSATDGKFNHDSDLSLFDKARSFAAIQHPENSKVSQRPHILLKGDISGIQKFIYDDIEYDTPGNTRGLSKQLRGRSFYIILLTEFIVSSLIRKFKLSPANVIYSGGGHFLMLLPNSGSMAELLDEFENSINHLLWTETSLRLTFMLSYVEAGSDVFDSVSDYIFKINHNLNSKKYKKNLNFLHTLFFEPRQSKEFSKDIKIGELLPKGKYLLEIYSEAPLPKEVSSKILLSFKDFNTSYFITDSLDDTKKILSGFQDPNVDVYLYKINHTDITEELEMVKEFSINISPGFKFIANFAPKSERGDILSFEEISTLDYQSSQPLSYPLLSILRLDVDNLGTIFAFGFEDNEKTLGRISALSRELHLFFCGIMNELAEKFKIYITYSGGDDAFFVGSWYNIIHFVYNLKNSFDKFHGYNPHLTFSAGIFTCHNRLPVAKFAEMAALAEKESKAKGKNKLTVFDVTLDWTQFIQMLGFAEKLLSCVEENDNVANKGKFSRALVHKLLRVIKSSVKSGEFSEEVDVQVLHKNITLLHYFFARHGFSFVEIEKNKNMLAYELVHLILNNFSKKELIRNYTIPMEYVLYKTRTLKNNIS
jgi:CRISPR-associated protein Csm1